MTEQARMLRLLFGGMNYWESTYMYSWLLITETDRSSEWQPWYSLETLKLVLNVSSEYQGCYSDDPFVSVIEYVRLWHYKAMDFLPFAIGYPFPFRNRRDLYWINVRLFSVNASVYVSDHCGTSAVNFIMWFDPQLHIVALWTSFVSRTTHLRPWTLHYTRQYLGKCFGKI